MSADTKNQNQLLSIKERIVQNFSKENWLELGVLTGAIDAINGHDRLLRSLSWGDTDYSGHALDMLLLMNRRSPNNLDIIKSYLNRAFPADGEHISSGEDVLERRVYFTPSVFTLPERPVDPNLVAVMMPFDARSTQVFQAIESACLESGLTCTRADNIWEHTAVVQDIFSLIFRSYIVVCDFTGRNPNVFYEAGIAHTLGKHVVPITQSGGDIPFDLSHHRYLLYLNNSEGLERLKSDLASRLQYLSKNREV